jgi:hypothetical protein
MREIDMVPPAKFEAFYHRVKATVKTAVPLAQESL